MFAWESQFLLYYQVIVSYWNTDTYFFTQFINFLSLQVRWEKNSVIVHAALLEFFTFADFSMLKTTQHSLKQNMYDLAERGQIIILFSNYELSVSVAGPQMINRNTSFFYFFFFCSFNIKSESTIYV